MGAGLWREQGPGCPLPSDAPHLPVHPRKYLKPEEAYSPSLA
jgi:hypothetical protein